MVDLQKDLVKEFGTALEAEPTGWLHTGNYALNWAVSGRFSRGWPLGLVTELFGDPSTGKSYLLLNAIRQVQIRGGIALLDDTEGAYYPDWGAQKIGIDNARLAYTGSHTVEDHSEILVKFLKVVEKAKGDQPSIIVLDSAALLSTTAETEKEFEKRDLKRAQDFKKLFRVHGKPLRKAGVAYFAANHVIANIGDTWNPRTTPTGSGLKFQSSLRVDLRTPKKIRDPKNREVLGVIIRAFVEKSRLSIPWREVLMAIPFYTPLNPYSGLIPVLLDIGLLGEKGFNLTLDGNDIGIKTWKSDFLKQDESAAELVATYPDILALADKYMAKLEEAYAGTVGVADGQGK